MKLFLIRHGQTDWNIKGKIQGSCDIKLNVTGIKQAEELSNKILENKYKFSKIYSSPQRRAVKTAEILSKAANVEYISIEGLEEINLGEWEGLLRTYEKLGFQYVEKYMPEIKDGDILFIEDSLKDATTIERSFSFLKINGVFDKISGIILGKHELFNDLKTGRKPYEILLKVLGDKKLPFLADFDCCHTHPMLNLPIGCKINLNATEKKVSIIEDWLK
jgi:muramoyltetrapeptide carboxypeptidase LdcA involved in peptidoglycan recycling